MTVFWVMKSLQEIEEDKRFAKDKNASLDVKRQSASGESVESQDIASRLGSGTSSGGKENASFNLSNHGLGLYVEDRNTLTLKVKPTQNENSTTFLRMFLSP